MIDNASLQRPNRKATGLAASSGDTFKDLKEETLKSFIEIETSLQDLKNNLKGNHFAEEKHVAEQEARRVEERRKAEEKERRLREKARDNKDPKRRVASMLEHSREFGQETRAEKVCSRIPTTVQKSLHTNGTENIEMVNVRALQARCLGLTLGACNYDAVKQCAENEEKHRRWEATNGEMKTDFIKTNKAAGAVWKSSYDANFLSKRVDHTNLRHVLAQERRTRMTEEKYRKKLASSRSLMLSVTDPSFCCSHQLASVVQEVNAEAMALGLPVSEYLKKGRMQQHDDNPIEPNDEVDICDSQQSLSRASLDRRGSLQASRSELIRARFKMPLLARRFLLSKARRSSSASISEGCSLANKRCQYLWQVIRSAFNFAWLFFRIRTQTRAADIMLDFLERQAELVSQLRAIRRRNAQVKRLVVCARSFIAKKRAWCEEVSAQWQSVEDLNLQQTAKPKDKHEFARSRSAASLSDRRRSSLLMPSRFCSDVDAWRAFKIPRDRRLFMLGRCYILQMKWHSQQRESFKAVIASSVTERKDLEEYYKSCGLIFQDAPARQATRSKTSSRSSALSLKGTGISDEDMLQLIGLAAFELRHEHPFQDHPANQNLPIQAEGSIAGRLRRVLLQKNEQAHHKDTSSSQPEAKGRTFSWGCASNASPQPLEVENTREDIDAVIERFSPRFLQAAINKQAALLTKPDEDASAEDGTIEFDFMRSRSVSGNGFL